MWLALGVLLYGIIWLYMKVDIFRAALMTVGANDIADENDGSVEQRTCSVFYKPALEATLRDFDFNFSRRSQTLSLLDETHPNWLYAYKYPSDCVRALRIVDGSGHGDSGNFIGVEPSLFEVRQSADGLKSVLLCDISPCVLIYTTSKVKEENFDPLFVDAMTMNLAMRICNPLKRDLKTLDVVKKMYDEMKSSAVFSSANEGGETFRRKSKYRK